MAEPRTEIGLIALDIDGTLVGDDMILGGRTTAAGAAATRRGIAVALVTGRMAISALPIAQELGLTGPIVAESGALVRAMPEPGSNRLGRLLLHRPLPRGVAEQVVRWCRAHDLVAHFNYLEWMVVASNEERMEEYRLFVGDRLQMVPDILVRASGPVTKIVAIGEGEHTLELLEEARRDFAGLAGVTISHPRFLEFLAPGVSKGSAIRWLARRLRLPLSRCLAIGDQYNDLEMISEVGHGVAMPSAPDGVLAVARYVAPPVGEEGAAQMIEAIALDGRRPEAVSRPRTAAAERQSGDDGADARYR